MIDWTKVGREEGRDKHQKVEVSEARTEKAEVGNEL